MNFKKQDQSNLIQRSENLLNSLINLQLNQQSLIHKLPSTFQQQQLDQSIFKLNKSIETEWIRLNELSNRFNTQLDDLIQSKKPLIQQKSIHNEKDIQLKQLECLQMEFNQLKNIENLIKLESNNIQFKDMETDLPIKFKQMLINDTHSSQLSLNKLSQSMNQSELKTIRLNERIEKAKNLINKLDQLIENESIEKPKQSQIEQNEESIQKLTTKTKELTTNLNAILSQCLTINPPHNIKEQLKLQSIPAVSFKKLVENLMNKSVSSGDPYIQLPDSNSIEFKHYYYPMITLLFKAKLIQYHPKDNSRIRLIDFSI